MGRFGGVTDFLPSLFVRVREQCPGARFFASRQTLMPEREQPHFHVDESRYAQDLGFVPHPDYKKAARVFGGLRAEQCS
jgi:hypothetical protein